MIWLFTFVFWFFGVEKDFHKFWKFFTFGKKNLLWILISFSYFAQIFAKKGKTRKNCENISSMLPLKIVES